MKNILPLYGGNLVYDIVGKHDAETIFFCHSLGANQSLWKRQIEQLSDSYRIVSCDLRGHGESCPSARLGIRSGILHRIECDETGADRIHAVGSSNRPRESGAVGNRLSEDLREIGMESPRGRRRLGR